MGLHIHKALKAMSTVASAAAAGLAKVPDDELIDALALIVSLRPNLQEPMRELAAQEPSPRHTGTITHFFPEKQYGFIKCDEVRNTYGWDTFLSDLELGPFAVGRTVSFTLVLNKQGKPQARLLKAAATPAWPAHSVIRGQRGPARPLKRRRSLDC